MASSMNDWRGGSTASGSTMGTDRATTIKAAFQSQFKSSFVCSHTNHSF